MGSRGFTGPLFSSNPVEVLVMDHHWSQGRFPEGAIVLSSTSSSPIVTSSTLAYILCVSFLKSQFSSSTAASLGLDYLCHISTSGNLSSVDWSSFAKEGGYYGELLLEDMKACEKKWIKKVLRDCVGLINSHKCFFSSVSHYQFTDFVTCKQQGVQRGLMLELCGRHSHRPQLQNSSLLFPPIQPLPIYSYEDCMKLARKFEQKLTNGQGEKEEDPFSVVMGESLYLEFKAGLRSIQL
ncbi:hypothetical protein ABKN59_010998 [Abortiporus biennis]